MCRILVLCFFFCLTAGAITPEMIEQERKNFWAYRPPVNHPVPNHEGAWGKNAIDAFIFENHKKLKLTPSSEADRRTLIRRVYFDLTGLPPSFEEVEAFANDKAPDAYERLIDKLLASPAYGERWGRHWLDVARYADTQGYNFTNSSKYPFSYTYRDYVIRSFNEDKPYNNFIVEQLAADLLKDNDKKNLAALGFLTTGERFLNKQDEIANDRIDVTTQAFLAMTVACARCHDHKVDPIPSADYYSLYGVFMSTREPGMEELPVIGEPVNQAAHKKYVEDKAKFEKELESKINEVFKKAEGEWPQFVDGIVDYIGQNRIHKKKEKRDYRNRALRKGHFEFLRNFISGEPGKKNNFYALLHHVYHRQNENDIPHLVNEFSNRNETPAVLKESLKAKQPKTREQVYHLYRDLIKTAFEAKDKPEFNEIREMVNGAEFRDHFSKSNKESYVERDERNQITQIQNKIKNLMTTEGAPPRAMVIYDKDKPYNPYVFNRGKAHDRGPNVNRRFPQVLSKSETHKKFNSGSGRLELAQSIADKDNPLTARVMVNRVWQWHFGEGIVPTPSNFGKMGLPPSNLKLLDHLSIWFTENGWSLKKLHKYIMTSATYMQTSEIRQNMNQIDEANKYLWRMNNRRLEWESMRDSMIQVAGRLSERNGGHPVDVMNLHGTNYRSVYGYLDREKIPGALKNFDFPSPQVTCEARINTVVPQQGLFMMNSKMVTDCSKVISSSLKDKNGDEEKIKALFRKTLSRLPSDEELKKALNFVTNQGKKFGYKSPKIEYGIAQFENNQLTKFQKFDFYKAEVWRFKGKFPHEKYEYASLRKDGGHPGGNFPVVTRMTVFLGGVVKFNGELHHPDKNGNGVMAYFYRNGSEIGKWHSKHNRKLTELTLEVKAGDIIDLAVGPNGDHGFDTYHWRKKIILNQGGSDYEIDFNNSFGNKQGAESNNFSVWDALAQVMLMSNEFLYVD